MCRLLGCALLLVGAAVPLSAEAAADNGPRRGCFVVTDPSGDTYKDLATGYFGIPVSTGDPALDIVGATCG